MLVTTMYLPSFVFFAHDIIIASRDTVGKLVSDFVVYSAILGTFISDDSFLMTHVFLS